jgi:hypothetical protein
MREIEAGFSERAPSNASVAFPTLPDQEHTPNINHHLLKCVLRYLKSKLQPTPFQSVTL